MKILFISLIVSTFFINGIHAQSISNYGFNTSQLAVLENMSGGTTQLIGPSTKDVSSGVTNIGFVFNFMGITYTQFSVNSNGQLRLGSTPISGTGISNAAPDQSLLVPVSGGNSILASGKVHFKVTGTSPNQIFIVEWKDLTIPNPIIDNNPPIIEFNPTQVQVSLYETSGLIEFKYGSVFNNSVPSVYRATFISSGNTANTVKYIGSDLISAIDASPVIPYPMDATNTAMLTQRSYSFEIKPDKSLTLSSVLLEGLYDGNGTMRQAYNATGPNWASGVADHITVELHDANSYSTIIYSITDVPLSTTGDAIINIPAIYNGLYYITIKHRNSIETSSATSVSFAGNSITHSFGDPANVYLGNVELSYDNFYLIYGGDVNQDGTIDTRDYTGVNNDSYNFQKGYLSTDVDVNGVIDTRDYTIINNNNYKFIRSKLPY